MRTIIPIIYIVFFISLGVYGQKVQKQAEGKSNIIFVQSSILNWSGEIGLLFLTANYEHLTKAAKNGYIAFSVGGGPIIGILDYYGTYPFINIEIDRLIGKQNHFFEIGAGLNIINTALLNTRVGYRLMAGNRFMFRSSYHLVVPHFAMGLSVSLGYRFGRNSNK